MSPLAQYGGRQGRPATLRAELQDGTALQGETLLRLACDSGLVVATGDERGNVPDIGRRRRTLSPALRRALLLRDRCCQFPGCAGAAYLEGHHIEHWARGGETRLDNILTMCQAHHLALHEGGYRVERRADGSLAFCGPRGRLIEAAPPRPPAQGDALGALARAQGAAGIAIDRRTSLPHWDGSPLRLGWAVEALAGRQLRAEARGAPAQSPPSQQAAG